MSPALKSIGGTLPLSQKFLSGSNGQLPNPDLEPEEGFSVDGGIDYSLPLNVSLSTRVFYTVLSDAIIDNDISRDSTHSQTMSINAAGKTVGKGGEFSVRQLIDDKIEWFANLTYTLSEIDNPDNEDQDSVELPFVPGMMNNVGVTLYLPFEIEISVWAHFGGECINVHAQKVFRLKKDKAVTLFIKAYNITDNTFTMPWQFQDPGFSITGGAEIHF